MNVVIDTNVLVSAALRDRDPETVILFVLEQDDYQWVVSPEILSEYKDVLSRKRLGLLEEMKQRWFYLLDTLTELVEVSIEIDFPRDQKDAKFLACALAADADFFITGDKDFTEAQKLLNTTIISVSQFKRLVCDSQP
ncbi:putative toxin-antitoxin system toxin component, PIN family [Egbenema bharatensis]|uniref:putative toxin-antitoxin system toxin component, PIN family n=1 Tax=Egbenema bharatensis TaxID=3463334 RepID=UPI003A85FD1E